MLDSSEKKKIEKLRSILLQKDRVKIQQLEETLSQRDKLSEKVVPIIEQQLEEYEQRFPAAYRSVVDNIIERKLKESQEDLLNLLYPILGTMIRKYIAQQLQQLKENIERQLRQSFLTRLKARFFGIADSELIISKAASSRVVEAYVIQQHSGVLLGSASSGKTIDKDMIAGMLTAIKAFVQDAFKRSDAQLELIDYGEYQILIQDMYSYFIALAVSGQLSSEEKNNLSEQMLTFADRELSIKIKPDDPSFHYHVKQKLEQYFIKPNI